MTYTVKRTRHRRLEAYNVQSDNGLKAIIEKVEEGKWRRIIHIGSGSSLIVNKMFTSMEEVAEYALKKAEEERDWANKNVLGI